MIPFNKPSIVGRELEHIAEAVKSGKISGNGKFTKACQSFFEDRYGFRKCLLTTSCTDALEMSAILLNILPGDEVILPSFTFVSTANAFVLRGARIVFADSSCESPNISVDSIRELITEKTKAIVVVHYAGIACEMDKIVQLAERHNIAVIEDAAQGVDAYFNGKPLGSMGCMSAFSFHETKNVLSGEGGMLVVNDHRFVDRSEIVWEKGTNRSAFFRGEVDKYGWVDIGSSFLPSDLTAAFLFGQLERLDQVQRNRLRIWEHYMSEFSALPQYSACFSLPSIPDFATNNAHMFYLLCSSSSTQQKLIAFLKEKGVHAVFHYLPLHLSSYFRDRHDVPSLPWSVYYSERIVRLPLYESMTRMEQEIVIDAVKSFVQLETQASGVNIGNI